MDGSRLEECLLQSLIGLEIIHSSGKVHGNLSPIYLGQKKETNDFIIIDDLRNQGNPDQVQLGKLTKKNREIYMSPQLYFVLTGKGKKKGQYDAMTNDLFALGLSILNIGTGQSI